MSLDAGARLPRLLPAAALFTFTPPAAFYGDSPIVDDVHVSGDVVGCTHGLFRACMVLWHW